MDAGAWVGAVLATVIYGALALMPDAAYERAIGRAPSRRVRVILQVVAAIAAVGLVAGIVIFSTAPTSD